MNIDPLTVGVMCIVALLVFLALRLPIAWSLGIAGLIGLLLLMPAHSAFAFAYQKSWEKMASYMLSVIPMFIFMGMLAFEAGIGRDAYEVSHKWLGWLPGGLAIATTMTAAVFAACSGSSTATCATIGKVSIPEMRKYGYDVKLATGCVAASGTLGILIPPSIILVVYGVITEQSIGKLFIAGILPGILSAIIYALMVIVRVKLNPSLAPAVGKVTWGERMRSMPKLWSIVILFLIVLGGIYMGVFTPTEAAAMACVAAILLLIIKSNHRVRSFWVALRETVSTVGMIFAILLGVSVFGVMLSLSTIPATVATFLINLPLPTYAVLGLILLLYIPLGMFLNPLAIIFITMPIIFPAITAMGFDPIWFGIILTVLIENGLITPPVGFNVFVVKSIVPDVPIQDIFRGILWFVVMDWLTIVILIIFPQISLWLPSTMTI